jgi:hypothetical protein
VSDASDFECLITGVMLHEIETDLLKPADLFRIPHGGGFVVNAVGEGETTTPINAGTKIASYSTHSRYFARRNVYIFSAGGLTFNKAAADYMEKLS